MLCVTREAWKAWCPNFMNIRHIAFGPGTYRFATKITDDHEEEPEMFIHKLTKKKQTTKKELQSKSQEPKTVKNKRIRTTSSSVFQSASQEVQDLVSKMKKESLQTNALYIIEKDAAQCLVNHLKKDLKKTDSIVESSPGPGILTKLLLSKTENNLVLYEPHAGFRSELQRFQHSFGDRVVISNLDLKKCYSYFIQGRKDSEKDKLPMFLEPLLKEHKKGKIKIICPVIDTKFLYRLNVSFAFQCCFFDQLYPEFYLFLPNRLLTKVTLTLGSFAYSKVGLPFQFYFKIKVLDKVSNSAFFPVFTLPANRRKKDPNDDFLHLLKITPDMDLFSQIKKEELESFHYFMNFLTRTRRNDSLINQMEKWIPDCGPEFIKNGFRVFVHPKELNKEELIKAFKVFSSLPSYEGSMFHHYRHQWAVTYGEKDSDSLKLKGDDIEDLEEVIPLDTNH
ncbi:mitochondrial transcription factor B2 [Oratosquilla oratoria]|uniref:mitochondrial transcription factor B2 n=1 Tax=Oratosquilla oratoria TaxID=337810 RepID=UPI003F76E9B3